MKPKAADPESTAPGNPRNDGERVTTLAGGVGAARFLSGLTSVRPAGSCDAIVNVADDFDLHGLHISPDLDTITYTLGGLVNPETGWGRSGETWNVMDELARLGGESWFRLGDRDLAVHLYRTQRLRAGADLATVTAELTASLGVSARLIPVTGDRLRTVIGLPGGETIDFQDYFVARRHSVSVADIIFEGAGTARPSPGVLESIRTARSVVIAPSNPLVSIAPVLAVAGVRDAVAARRESVVAVSPIIGGKAVKGPAARMLTEMGHEASALGVARLYRDLAATMVIDTRDADLAAAVEDLGMRCVVTETMMTDPGRSADLAGTVLRSVGGPIPEPRRADP
ncbi:MAG TPA: 2-phospho-L-lactate transferase [Acidimicrobiales bacterium]|nr:2-phospho-L-lactate transferase [Acidimicrobiales bacterium]